MFHFSRAFLGIPCNLKRADILCLFSIICYIVGGAGGCNWRRETASMETLIDRAIAFSAKLKKIMKPFSAKFMIEWTKKMQIVIAKCSAATDKTFSSELHFYFLGHLVIKLFGEVSAKLMLD